MNVSGMEDALNPRMAGSTEGMTLQVLAQIRDSLAAQTRDVRALTEGVTDVRERVIRLEERDRRLAEVESKQTVTEAKVEILMQDKDRRDGATGMLKTIKDFSPFIAAVMATLAAAWLFGRSLGITPAPPVNAVRIEATAHPEERRIEGIVGGKPK